MLWLILPWFIESLGPFYLGKPSPSLQAPFQVEQCFITVPQHLPQAMPSEFKDSQSNYLPDPTRSSGFEVASPVLESILCFPHHQNSSTLPVWAVLLAFLSFHSSDLASQGVVLLYPGALMKFVVWVFRVFQRSIAARWLVFLFGEGWLHSPLLILGLCLATRRPESLSSFSRCQFA